MTRQTPVNHTPKPGDARNAGIFIVGFIIFLALIGQCTSRRDAAKQAERMVDTNMGASIAAQSPPPPPASLDLASITRGVAHMRLAFGAEGFSGAMIYSQNCYDLLGRQFSWAQLDRCGAFDVMASRSIEAAEPADLTTENDYFQSEAVAGRYLAAATGAGQEAGAADTRLAELQRRVGGMRIAAQRAPASQDNEVAAADSADEMGDAADSDLPIDAGVDDGNRVD